MPGLLRFVMVLTTEIGELLEDTLQQSGLPPTLPILSDWGSKIQTPKKTTVLSQMSHCIFGVLPQARNLLQ